VGVGEISEFLRGSLRTFHFYLLYQYTTLIFGVFSKLTQAFQNNTEV
jgi:hypothetical protein